MKRFLLCIALAVASAFTWCWRTLDDTAYRVVRVYRRARDWLLDINPISLKPAVRNLPGPAVALIAAKQFLLRQVKRQRPVRMPCWSMCPSG